MAIPLDGRMVTCAFVFATAFMTAFADTNLTENADWTGRETAALAGRINLNGHTLTVSNLTGSCEIVNMDYELLDSITSTGTQYIDTGVIGKSGLTASADLAITVAGSSDHFILGARETTTEPDDYFCMLGYNKNTSSLVYYDTYNTGAEKRFTVGEDCHVEASATDGSQTMSVDGTIWSSRKQSPLTKMTRSLYAFACNRGGTAAGFSKIRLYGMTISDGAAVLRNFVPAKRCSDGKVGLLDLANRGENEFYANQAASGADFTAGAVTGYICDANASGELHVVVAGGTLMNETVTLSGALKLVKEGAGMFVAAKTGQTYAGGTEVAAGTFLVGTDDEKTNGFAGMAGSAIRVDAGATLDVNGNPGFETHPLVLAGGTVKSAVGQNSITDTTPAASLGSITLEADSTVTPSRYIYQRGSVDLGGHLLTVRLGSGMHYVLTEGVLFAGSGTVYVTSGGYTRFDGTVTRDMGQVNLIMNCALNIAADIMVNDLELRWNSGNNFAAGGGHVYIRGAFKPTSANGYHRNCVMLDGSTLNLDGKTGAWPLEPNAPTSGAQACNVLAFAEGARVNVTLGARQPKNGPIVTWQTGNAPGDSVTFVKDPALKAQLIRKSDGLWLQTGLLILIR